MLFSSIEFLFWFLPLCIVCYFVAPKNIKNTVLVVFSLLFYYYAETSYLIIMLSTITLAYGFGFLIDKAKNKLAPTIMSVGVSLSFLLYFKYTDFFISNINLFGANFDLLNIILPIGVSFYTFQAISYTIDLYRGNAKLQTNYINFACYICFFPQLIAGPIVRYTVIEEQLKKREHSIDKFSDGAFRLCVGLGKKVMIANVLGEFVEKYNSSQNQSTVFAWAWIIAYCLQIYFDFSGYSDMAIGLAKMFGFNLPENFNYPFISKSIAEFWRRWHISLGSWFRDYVYIPMGGNRVSSKKWIVNILTVWFLTGFWHGAAWNFILWGLYFALFLFLEKKWLNKFFEKKHSVIKHIYVLFIISLSFVIFASEAGGSLVTNLYSLFGGLPLINEETIYYLKSYGVSFLIGIIGATPLLKIMAEKLKGRLWVQNALRPVIMLLILICVTAFLIDGSFNPFLYFRF